MSSAARWPWRYAAFYAAQFAINAVYQNFSGPYFRSVGLSNTAVGLFAALSPVVALLAQPLWGRWADRAKSKNRILLILLIGSTLTVGAYALSPAYGWLAAMVAANAFFFTSVSPLGDAICLESATREGFRFGPIRWAGTACFALVVAASGLIIGDAPARMIPLTTGFAALCVGSVLLLPKVSGHQQGEKRRMRELLGNRQLMLLIAAACAMMVSMAVFYAFFSVHLTETLGATSAVVGWAFFISSVSETPFLFLSDRIMKKLGAPRMLLISCLIIAVRMGILAATRSTAIALASQALHGGCFIVLSYTMIRYVDRVVPEALKASGQMLYAMLSINLARVLGSLLGGALSDTIGMSWMFAAASALAAVTCGYIYLCIRKGWLNAAGEASPS